MVAGCRQGFLSLEGSRKTKQILHVAVVDDNRLRMERRFPTVRSHPPRLARRLEHRGVCASRPYPARSWKHRFHVHIPAARKSLTALSLFLIHIFASNLATLAAWELLGVNPNVVTARSMLAEIAVTATGALPVVPSAAITGMPLTVSIVLLPLRNISPERLTVYLPLVACLLWVLLACQGLRLT